MLPPMYPTRASSRPVAAVKFLRYRYSTPQKQPAATVASLAPAGSGVAVASVVTDMVAGGVVNGRRSRCSREVIAIAMTMGMM